MEIALWLFKVIAAPIAAIIVTLLFSETLKSWLSPIVLKLGSRKEEGVSGLWTATFFYGKPEISYIEVIELSTLLGYVVGRIVPHTLNQGAAKRVQWVRPLRVKGTVKDNRFFSGTWIHPERLSHHYGAYDLIIRQNNTEMQGMWLGYSESKNIIETGRWEWRRI